MGLGADARRAQTREIREPVTILRGTGDYRTFGMPRPGIMHVLPVTASCCVLGSHSSCVQLIHSDGCGSPSSGGHVSPQV